MLHTEKGCDISHCGNYLVYCHHSFQLGNEIRIISLLPSTLGELITSIDLPGCKLYWVFWIYYFPFLLKFIFISKWIHFIKFFTLWSIYSNWMCSSLSSTFFFSFFKLYFFKKSIKFSRLPKNVFTFSSKIKSRWRNNWNGNGCKFLFLSFLFFDQYNKIKRLLPLGIWISH